MFEFGKHVQTKVSEDGLQRTTTTYRMGSPMKQDYYEERVKVKNETEELQRAIRFMKEKKGKKRSTRIEYPNGTPGFYYLVLCWED